MFNCLTEKITREPLESEFCENMLKSGTYRLVAPQVRKRKAPFYDSFCDVISSPYCARRQLEKCRVEPDSNFFLCQRLKNRCFQIEVSWQSREMKKCVS